MNKGDAAADCFHSFFPSLTEYIQAMILVKDAIINHNSTLIKDHRSVTKNAEENKSSSLPLTSYEDFFPKDCTSLSTENQEIPPMENKVADLKKKKKKEFDRLRETRIQEIKATLCSNI